MNRIVLLIAFTLAACSLKAQEYPFGKSRDSIRKEIRSVFPFMELSKNAVCDTLSIPGGVRVVYYYRNSKCYMMKEICPLAFEKILREAPGSSYKKLKENTWTNLDDGAMIKLVIVKNKNQCVFEYVPAKKENKSSLGTPSN